MTGSGAIVDFDRRGSGEPLLLIHGFTATWRMWGPLASSVAHEFDVFTPTLPGHTGGPPLSGPPNHATLADGLEAMLDELGWEQPHVAGFSLGGWLAFELAKRGRARTVTAISPAGSPLLHSGKEGRRVARTFRQQRSLAKATLPIMPAIARSAGMRRFAMREMMVRGDRMSAADLIASSRDFVKTPMFDDLLRESTGKGFHDLHHVRCPVHLVWGAQDRVIPVRHAAYFQDGLPDASLRLLAGAGHVPFWDVPDELTRELRRGTGRVKSLVAGVA